MLSFFLREIVVVSRTQLFILAGHQPRNQDCGFGVILSPPPPPLLVFPIFLRGRGPSSKQPSESSERDYWHFYPSSFVQKWRKKHFIFPRLLLRWNWLYLGTQYTSPKKENKIPETRERWSQEKKNSRITVGRFFLKKERRRRFPTSFIMFCVVSFSA